MTQPPYNRGFEHGFFNAAWAPTLKEFGAKEITYICGFVLGYSEGLVANWGRSENDGALIAGILTRTYELNRDNVISQSCFSQNTTVRQYFDIGYGRG